MKHKKHHNCELLGKNVGARLVEIDMPCPIWMRFPAEARHAFYQGTACLVTWNNPGGSTDSIAKIFPHRIPDAVFDPDNWK